jgi:putative transcriptional regulator
MQGGCIMAVTYKKLLHMLIDKNMSVAELQKQAGYSANISTRLRNDTYVSLESVEKICRVLNCKIDDIVEFVPKTEKSEDRLL